MSAGRTVVRELTPSEEYAARVARATYWSAIGDVERAAAEPSPESLGAWFLALAVGTAFRDCPPPNPPALDVTLT